MENPKVAMLEAQHNRLAPHVEHLRRITDDMRFELELIDEFLTPSAEGDIAESRIERSGDVLREALEDAYELFDNMARILRGEATESPLDPENEMRFII